MVKRLTDRAAAVATVMLMTALLWSCSVTQNVTDTKDMSYLYNPSKNVYAPFITVYDEDATTSVITISIRRSEFYFSEANPEGVPIASMLISVRLRDNTSGGVLADTATYKYDLKREEIGGDYAFRVPLKTLDGNAYTAEIKIIDLIRQKTLQTFIDFERTGKYSKLNYKIRDYFTKKELNSFIVRRDQYVNVLCPSLQPDTLWVFYFKPVKDIPPSPSTMLPEVTLAPEPAAIVPLTYSDTLPMMFPAEGIYLISPDSLIREGLIIYNFGPDHPSMTSPETMVPPLAYLATPQEMDEMLPAEKPKLALDKFWLDRTGSIERSKELIRIYYNRTLFSNYYFSSYKAGWLTDRGMIYIIYGPPDKVYKNNEGESWGYRKPPVKSRWGSRYSVEDQYLWFNFRKQKNIFSDNDFILNRGSTPISYWDIAVARWREGKVFRLDNPEELQ
ncbi:MAG: GWxTD domain-containing protein [Bacteroidales bacterium]|jgi:GWxTD domain-containing protein|nr:GWxTD domain-containing protein [Bacteroidales bacterium]